MLLVLQEAVRTVLGQSAALKALVGTRVYDKPPANTAEGVAKLMPYVTIGEDQLVDQSNICSEFWEAFVPIHCWSQKPGYPEAKAIADTVYRTLKAHDALHPTLRSLGHTVTGWKLRNTLSMRDPDGVTSHIVIEFRGLLAPLA